MTSANNRDARDYRLFLAATILVGLGSCVNTSIFNNYLKDVFNLDVARRTFLELPRETPGFLVSLLVATLAALGEVRIAMVANLAASAGMLALGWIPSSFVLMVSSTFLYSAGQHVYMPLSSAIGMGFAAEGKEGSALGRISATSTTAILGGTLVLLGLLKLADLSYRAAFTAGAGFYLAAALALLSMSPRRSPGKPRRLVVKRRYARYYVLSVLYGARKQLFITFGPWMLVDLFRQDASAMTLIALVAAAATIGAQALAGKLTDRFGPRAVLGGEAFVTIFVCMIYAFSPELLPAGTALVVVAACYVIDQASNSVGMARAVYASRIAEQPADVSPTLSIGISIDHVASMTIPMIGGIAWMGGGARGYRWVFLGGAAIAALNFIVTRGISIKRAPIE
jgi:predicted MFS family arabinose efflux permease